MRLRSRAILQQAVSDGVSREYRVVRYVDCCGGTNDERALEQLISGGESAWAYEYAWNMNV